MQETYSFIKEKTNGIKPQIGLILGSGLGSFADDFENISISYSDIPGFEKPKIQGHKGRLVFADIEGKSTVIMQGRYHYYEGYSMQTVTFPIKIMKLLGIKTLIITNAAGAVSRNLAPSDIMFITDHINFMGTNPLIGENNPDLGTRFPDMSEVYSKQLILKAENAAKKVNIQTKKGVYAATSGPSYETPAEIKMFEILGANAVGMSTLPEAIVAKWCGLDVLGISCITNYSSGVSNKILSHDEVIETANKMKNNFKILLTEIIKTL